MKRMRATVTIVMEYDLNPDNYTGGISEEEIIKQDMDFMTEEPYHIVDNGIITDVKFEVI